jgi:hypothetical protein
MVSAKLWIPFTPGPSPAGLLSMGMVMGAAMMGANMAARAMGGAGAVAGLAGSGGAVQNAFSSAQQHISNGVGRPSGDRNAIENVSGIGRLAGQMLGGIRQGSAGTGSTQIGSSSQSGGGGPKILRVRPEKEIRRSQAAADKRAPRTIRPRRPLVQSPFKLIL